jgi:hypothetical protein
MLNNPFNPALLQDAVSCGPFPRPSSSSMCWLSAPASLLHGSPVHGSDRRTNTAMQGHPFTNTQPMYAGRQAGNHAARLTRQAKNPLYFTPSRRYTTASPVRPHGRDQTLCEAPLFAIGPGSPHTSRPAFRPGACIGITSAGRSVSPHRRARSVRRAGVGRFTPATPYVATGS